MSVDTYTASTTWVAPTGVTSVQVECWGGGQAGANGTFITGGAGGLGGYYVLTSAYTVTPGTSYTVTVGTGGASNGNAGGDTWFDSTSGVLAPGGNSGSSPVSADQNHAGGSGGTSGMMAGGGGGGGSGGNGSKGNNGTNGSMGTGGTGGAALSDGGAGGNGSGSGAGSQGTAPGGGGGGGGTAMSGNSGAAGMDGQVKLTYTAAVDDGLLLLADDDGFAGVMNTGCCDIMDGNG